MSAPEATAEVPQSESLHVARAISPAERMPADNPEIYLGVGRSALDAIQLAQRLAALPAFNSILDMPCGHGRVTRWLRAAYPHARITACDLLRDGADFCAAAFGATPVYSNSAPTAEMFPGRYDLIFVGSLLTHVDADQWDRLIALWRNLLAPGGLLVVTTHGERAAERMRAGDLYGYPVLSIARLLRTYASLGFGFLEESPVSIDYGITLAKPYWTLNRLLRHEDLTAVLYAAALWDQHQDVAAVVLRPVGPAPRAPNPRFWSTLRLKGRNARILGPSHTDGPRRSA